MQFSTRSYTPEPRSPGSNPSSTPPKHIICGSLCKILWGEWLIDEVVDEYCLIVFNLCFLRLLVYVDAPYEEKS